MLLRLLRATSQQSAVSLYFCGRSIHKSELYVEDFQVFNVGLVCARVKICVHRVLHTTWYGETFTR